ncbi:unnamed protein product [Acanthoscelides obtectus]|uniref:Uncharacterized protein n=3 Tax=Acanthoscelides obtectus TaxID=200917 RepID=A0A9P0JPJ5_ACAOB|nr:unnamed protein product [Acanthoscelides obtectus]CAH1967072.1 unnamed protein product [Acanthoscelides obtectus]CAH1974119.1 unnamed protein product [Acanthoscelides obtectus]CAH2009800.1 unnamed protein product [Acanthoscelides obtectus]CAK1642564.1 hypothetical protein AOBTE_LOCUS13117 [Acanthoscelides obtectus]
MNIPTYRARKILNSLDNTRKKEDKEDEYEYESSPAPSISGDMSFLDFDSDDSMKDPTFKPEVKDKQTTFFDLQKTEDVLTIEKNNEKELEKKEVKKKEEQNNAAVEEIMRSDIVSTDEQLNEKSPKIVILSNIDVSNFNQISETQTKTTTKKKRTKCKFCQTDVTNFERHLERNHDDTKEVQDMMSFPKSHPERKKILSLLRNAANFTEYLKGNVQPKYHYKTESKEYYPCSRCKAMLSKSYLSRHKKNCILKHTNNNEIRKMNSLAASQTLIASSFDENSNLHKLRVKEEVFDRMKPDYISLVAKSDYLIYNFGENYLKKHRREQLVTVCSNKMRELARFLIQFRKMTNNSKFRLQDVFKPKLFDMTVECAKHVGGYEKYSKTYRAPSLPAHLGTSLKQVCELFTRLVLKEDEALRISDKEEALRDINRFRELINTQWTTEISSLAFKDLNEKQWEKPAMLPLTRDITKFKDYVTNVANKAMTCLTLNPTDRKEMKKLIQASLILTILFNRKRIGDVQYTKLSTYINYWKPVNQEECEKALSQSEKILTKYYKRIVTGGKGSRPIAILFPQTLQTYIDFFVKIRQEHHLVPENNPYLFGCPGTSKWTRGDVIIRKFAQEADLEFPKQISSNRLRKQIATVMQILNLSKEESEQFAHFMGHTEKTHNEFYKLPQDVYQTAKISKLLMLMEKGVDKYKGKSLNEININPMSEFAEEESDNEDNDFLDANESDCTAFQAIPEEESRPVSKKKISGRTFWTSEQALLVKKHFKSHISTKKAPKKNECMQLIGKYPEIFHDKDWVRVKTFVYNIYRNK